MICSYCGASYRKNAERCPNCQSENPLMIEKRKNRVRQSIDKQAMEEVKDLPEKKVKKAHSIVVIVIAGLLTILIIGGSLGYVWSKYKAKIEYAAYQRNVEKMEELIAGEQWEEFYDYYYDHECWDSKYEKYEQLVDAKRQVDDTYYYCQRYFDILEDLERDGIRMDVERAREYLDSTFRAYVRMCNSNQKNVKDRVILGNEKLLKQFEEEITTFLQDALQMTQEEIEFLKSSDEETDFSDLINQYIERDTK